MTRFPSIIRRTCKSSITVKGISVTLNKVLFCHLSDEVSDENCNDDGVLIRRGPSWSNYLLHILTVFWKVLFAFVPPTDLYYGYPTFVCSIAVIGLLTAIIGDAASHFGCTVYLKDSVTAISIVALGTSVPDLFASKVAAIQDVYADASIGNVTGSNAVNVFLGIGIAWSIAAIYHSIQGDQFLVNAGSLNLSVTVFCVAACATVIVLLLRRYSSIGGELGGPYRSKLATSAILVSFWLLYLTIASLYSYGALPEF